MLKSIPIKTRPANGTAGMATAAGMTSEKVNGMIVGLYIQYNGHPATTTNVTLKTLGLLSDTPGTCLIFEALNQYLDRHVVLSPLGHTIHGQPANIETTSGVPVNDFVKLEISNANPGDVVEAWLQVMS